jgi:diguanylate cyclase (GGDEF)-like protein
VTPPEVLVIGPGKRTFERILFALAAAVLLGTIGYLIIQGIRGYDLADLTIVPGRSDNTQFARHPHELLAWIAVPAFISLVVLLSLLAIWARRARGEDAVRAELNQKAEHAEQSVKMLERSRKMLAEWNRKLRHELSELHHRHGPLGSDEDVPELVLRMSVELTDSEKGLLFSRRDAGADGLSLAAQVGFDDEDPAESDLGKRFAREVIERDQIVREEVDGEPREGAPPGAVQNLIAVPLYMSDEFSGVVVCVNSATFGEHEDEVLIALGDHAGAVLENSQLHGELRGAYVETVEMLADAIRAKDPHLGGHSKEVSNYVRRVAEQLPLEDPEREQLIFASLLHDVGKIGISEQILLKPDSLTSEEFTVIKLHPRIGSRLVEQVAALAPLAPSILHHHERFDGTGYPSGLRGEEIPLASRVIGVADAFSAMTSDRPYRGRMSLEAACAELERCAGTQFDPEVVRLFVEEVRAQPPDADDEPGELETAMSDPELATRLAEGELLVGRGPLELIDGLTLLYTHRYFHEVVEAEAERAEVQERPFGVILIELAEIERINRESGYAAGDAAIQTVGHIVQGAAVKSGGTAARHGGACFGLLLPHTDAPGTEACRDELERSLANAPATRVVAATWNLGDDGDAVIDRARGVLDAAPSRA